MHKLAKNSTITGSHFTLRKRSAKAVSASAGSALTQSSKRSRASLLDTIEDAELNAIADERSDGPFIEVSLDDL